MSTKALSILVADELSAEGLDILREAGRVVTHDGNGMSEDELLDAVGEFDALIVRSATKVTARSLERSGRLTVIGRAGIGIDNIDVAAATERGIVVMNTPEAGAVTTGEHAIALLVSMARNIAAADAALKAGRWDKSKFTGTELRGKTFGVLGLGRIGQIVAERAHGLAMSVIAHDPYARAADQPSWLRLVELDELLAETDIMSIHVPLSDGTRHLLNRERIAKMKPGARLVHAARGGVVDDEALCDALESGHLAGAALDVFEVEPLPQDHRLRKMDNVVLTPHLGASTREAKRNVSLDMANQIVLCLRRGIVLNGINVPRVDPAAATRTAPFLDLARALSALLAQIHPGPIRSLRLSAQGELTAQAVGPMTVGMLAGALQWRTDQPVTPVNAERVAKDLGVDVQSDTSTWKRDFVNLIRIEAKIGDSYHSVAGTVLGHRHGRMLELDGSPLDAIPEGSLLVTTHRDEPGVIGTLGTVLGAADVNISRLQLGRLEPKDADGGSGDSGDSPTAVGIVNLSAPLPDELLQKIRAEPAILTAHRVEL